MADVPARSATLAKLQQQYLEGKHTDLVIRVRIRGEQQQEEPAPKRQRVATAAAAATAATDRYTDIKAHVMVLSARSAYFDKALQGDWAEAAERRVELTLADEQELDDLKLLIKLSYSYSYTHDDDGQLLPLQTRVRLAMRGDALEFVEAVDQVVASLGEGMDFEGAIQCLDGLPPALEAHPGMEAAQSHAETMLCTHLGPVVGMFEETTALADVLLPLRDAVKQLSPRVFKRLLASEALRLQLENEAYALLVAWVRQSLHVDSKGRRLALFAELAPLLRYHHMTLDFLSNIVCLCPLMQKSGLLPAAMHAAFVQRNTPSAILDAGQVDRGLPNRGLAHSEVMWELKTSFTREGVAALEAGRSVRKKCGVVGVYPAEVRLKRRTSEDGETLAAYLIIKMPTAPDAPLGKPAAGVALNVVWLLSPKVKLRLIEFFDRSWGFLNIFQKPWAEAVSEGSPHFPDGKLEVKLTVKLALKE